MTKQQPNQAQVQQQVSPEDTIQLTDVLKKVQARVGQLTVDVDLAHVQYETTKAQLLKERKENQGKIAKITAENEQLKKENKELKAKLEESEKQAEELKESE